ncbi:MAG TPA: acetate--CoA ligase family protein [Nitrososphaera sp.]|jgi:4-hydroxybutyryl-CoA synthetase (ADP-forming)|nr:acetate--CoA ligase family protein [Nitrososphaera sp.]
MSNSIFFSPQSIAVIGASEKPGIGKTIFTNIAKHFKGKIFPVTPSNPTVGGLVAYKSVVDIPESVDLAVVAAPSRFTPAVVEEVGRKGIKGAIIVSAGFKEVDEEGARLEREVGEIARRYGIRVIGPNCLGIMSLSKDNMMNSTFLKITPKFGGIALVSQSGAICAATVEDAEGQNIGFSKVISMGNKVDMDESDILELLAEDEDTKVIIMYLEDIRSAKRFMDISKRITTEKKKPIIVLKAGRSAEGAKAAASHTGALGGSDANYEAAFAQCGVIRVDTMGELFDLATAFSKQPLPNGGVVIVSNAGGPAIISTDSCSRYGLKMADISSIRDAIAKVIPAYGSPRNPVDIVGDADYARFENVLLEVLVHPEVGSVVTMCTPSATLNYDDLARVLVKMSSKFLDKTILASLMGLAEGVENRAIMSEGGVPYYLYAEPAIRTLKAMYDFKKWVDGSATKAATLQFAKDSAKVRSIFESVRAQGRANLLEEEGYEVLKAYGFPTPKSILGTTEEECVSAAKEIGYPVVMKIASPDIIHKSDAGGVKVGVKSDDELRAAFRSIIESAKKYKSDAKINGVLVQEMVRSAKETILGASQDPTFGPVIMFGLGGIYVEVLKDVVFRVAPINEREAMSMVQSIKTIKLLKGVRGEKPSDLKAIADSLQRLSQLLVDFPEIKEFDINPLLVLEEGKGARVVDSRIILKS